MVNFIPTQVPSLARSAAAQMCGEGRGQEDSVCAGSAQACAGRSPASPALRALWPVRPSLKGGQCPQGSPGAPPTPALPASGSGDEGSALGLGDQPYPGDAHSVWTFLAVPNLIS